MLLKLTKTSNQNQAEKKPGSQKTFVKWLKNNTKTAGKIGKIRQNQAKFGKIGKLRQNKIN